jgi:uncharacterized membrane protein YsdA (DUF1294 family)/cold shock CspA family protein
MISWEDGKGFGWIESNGRRIFAHIRDFERGQRRPAKGEAVTFLPGVDDQGRSCAKRIRFVRQGGRVGFVSWIILLLLLPLPLLALDDLPFAAWVAPSWFVLISIFTYGLYVSDKNRAESGRWRIPEKQLHFFEMLGGWPGAWIAQRRLRHKIMKGSYQFTFWFIIIVHQAVAADYLTGRVASRWIIARIRAWM